MPTSIATSRKRGRTSSKAMQAISRAAERCATTCRHRRRRRAHRCAARRGQRDPQRDEPGGHRHRAAADLQHRADRGAHPAQHARGASWSRSTSCRRTVQDLMTLSVFNNHETLLELQRTRAQLERELESHKVELGPSHPEYERKAAALGEAESEVRRSDPPDRDQPGGRVHDGPGQAGLPRAADPDRRGVLADGGQGHVALRA